MLRVVLPLLLAACSGWSAQSDSRNVHELEKRPVYRVDVVEKVTIAINYRHRSGATRVDFRGTLLMPRAEGVAKVESQRGYIGMEVELKKLQPAMTFGAEYLTYVMWAITPEGRASNLGEVLVKNGESKLNVTTELQVFGLIVTAEPYFAVRDPSDLVVLENEVRKDTQGKIDTINTRYGLLKRGQYQRLANPLMLTVDPKLPLELYEGRNAVQIARASGANQYARDTFLKAERSLSQAEAYQARQAGGKPVAMLAREAVQTAEDAREIAIRRQEEERLAKERQAASDREMAAKRAMEEESKRRADAETARHEEEQKRAEAERRADARTAERAKLEQQLASLLDAAKKAQEDALRAQTLLSEERARWQQERERRQNDELERDARLESLRRADLRQRLANQIGGLLPTRQSERGVAVDLPENFFESELSALSRLGREKLATLAGFLLAHPGLEFRVVNTALTNGAVSSSVSTDRMAAVEQYLNDHALKGRVATTGFAGKDADGIETDGAGRSHIRLMILGDPIGVPVSGSIATP